MALNGEDVVSFERDDLHRETLRHYANGLSQQQCYDEVGRLTQQLMLNGHDKGYQAQTQNNAIQHTSQLIERLYHYDKTGELTLIKDTRRGAIHYKYDPVGRLLEATSKFGKETFNFDPASNILDRYNSTKEQSAQHNSNEKGLGYNRLVNNVVQEYLDQQYQYDAFGQLIRQKSSQGDLNLEWDVLGRLVRSRNNQYTAEYRYDALGRRIQKRSKHHHTGQEQNIIYGWDGDTLAYESSADITKHYFYEKDSFVPLLQAAYHHSIELHHTQDWKDKKYSIYKDPLWNTVKQSQGFDDVWFYHCDHLGTPQEMSNKTGAIVWKAQYKAWGECKVEQAKSDFFENSEIISNNIPFQGQYFDGETGLHYNRYRYYSPYVGRFIFKDPIGLLGGDNNYAYTPSPVNWIDPLGLQKSKDPARQKCPTGKWIKHPEVESHANSYNEARRMAMQKSGLDKAVSTIPFIADIGPRKGEVVGSQSIDGMNHWRVDYDPNSNKQFHVNWRKIYQDKKTGNCIMERGAILVPGGKDAYLQKIERMPKL